MGTIRRLTGVASSLARAAAVATPLASGVLTATPSAASVNAGSIAIGYENNGADPSIISVANKYFQREMGRGVRLKLFTSGPAALTSLASGQLPFMCGLGMPPVIAAVAQGVPLQVVFNQERYTKDAGLVVKKSSGIKSVAGLAGKSVGLVIGSQSSFELATYAHQAGLKLSSVRLVNLTPPELQSAWSTGRIAAVAKAFVKALGDGVNYLQTHRTAAMRVMAKAAGISVATAKLEIAGYQIYSVADQATAAVLGTSTATSAKSGTAQSLLNNWKALYNAGTITVKPPKSAGAFVNPSYAK